MTAPIRLIPLQCPRCSTHVTAQPGEVAWVCGQCGQGMLLSAEQGAAPLDVFFSAAIAAQASGFPYWVTRGVVRLSERQTYRGNSSREMQEFWAVPRLFYVPAYQLPVEDVVAAGVRLLRQPVRMERGSPIGFAPVVVGPENVQPVAEFVVMSVEADRRDALRSLTFDIHLDPPQLWILP